MTKQEAIQEQIDNIMDDFEFEKVHQIMTALKWTWATAENPKAVPELWEIKKNARSHLECGEARRFRWRWVHGTIPRGRGRGYWKAVCLAHATLWNRSF